MNLFDFLNKLVGQKTREERYEDERRQKFRQREAERRAAPRPTPIAPTFTPTRNDPEYYHGQARTEGEAQRMVNEYRERSQPGIKPLFPHAAPGQYATVERPQMVTPRQITPLPVDDERHRITMGQF